MINITLPLLNYNLHSSKVNTRISQQKQEVKATRKKTTSDMSNTNINMLLNHNALSDHHLLLSLASAETFVVERGPRYKAYADFRETRLRMRKLSTPPRKPVSPNGGQRRGSFSVLAQSVPDFSATLKKENRKPVIYNALPPPTTTPSPSKSFVKSESAREKNVKKALMTARKSYASIDDLRSLSSAAAGAIKGEGRRNGRVLSVSGNYRQF